MSKAVNMPAPDDNPTDGRDDGTGIVWFTIRAAAAFTGRDRQTIYSWERRGHLTNPQHDEHGRRIYTQAQIAAAYALAQARDNRRRAA